MPRRRSPDAANKPPLSDAQRKQRSEANRSRWAKRRAETEPGPLFAAARAAAEKRRASLVTGDANHVEEALAGAAVFSATLAKPLNIRTTLNRNEDMLVELAEHARAIANAANAFLELSRKAINKNRRALRKLATEDAA